MKVSLLYASWERRDVAFTGPSGHTIVDRCGMRVPRGEHKRWKCRTQRRPAALLTMCHRASSLVVSRPFLSSLFSSYPSFSFLSISFLDIPVPPNACCACVRAWTQVRTKGIWVYNANRGLPCSGQYTTTRQRRATTRCFPGIRYRRSRFTRDSMCTHKHVYMYLQNASYILVCILYTDRRIHIGIYRCMYLGLPVDPSGFASPRTYTRSRGNARTANERASERASQPRRHGCALLTYTPVLLSVLLSPTGPSSSYDRGLAI